MLPRSYHEALVAPTSLIYYHTEPCCAFLILDSEIEVISARDVDLNVGDGEVGNQTLLSEEEKAAAKAARKAARKAAKLESKKLARKVEKARRRSSSTAGALSPQQLVDESEDTGETAAQ